MPAATVEIPVPNATTEVGLPGSVVRARIEPLKLEPFSTLASITSEMARGRSARSEPSIPRNRWRSVPLMSYTARMALGVNVRAASEPAAARAVSVGHDARAGAGQHQLKRVAPPGPN